SPENVPEVRAAKAALDLADKNLRRYEKLDESGDVSRAIYDQQKSQRDQAAVDAAQTNLSLAKRNLSYTNVTAPMTGYISDRPADVGEYVSQQQKVATIVNLNPLRVRIDIPEQSIPQIRVGESVSVAVSAYPDRNFSGRIARISPSVSTSSRTMTIEADVQ